jgi:hypothetical protein
VPGLEPLDNPWLRLSRDFSTRHPFGDGADAAQGYVPPTK